MCSSIRTAAKSPSRFSMASKICRCCLHRVFLSACQSSTAMDASRIGARMACRMAELRSPMNGLWAVKAISTWKSVSRALNSSSVVSRSIRSTRSPSLFSASSSQWREASVAVERSSATRVSVRSSADVDDNARCSRNRRPSAAVCPAMMRVPRPGPGWDSRIPWACSTRMASLTAPRLTPNSLARSRSGGSFAPTLYFPLSSDASM